MNLAVLHLYIFLEKKLDCKILPCYSLVLELCQALNGSS